MVGREELSTDAVCCSRLLANEHRDDYNKRMLESPRKIFLLRIPVLFASGSIIFAITHWIPQLWMLVFVSFVPLFFLVANANGRIKKFVLLIVGMMLIVLVMGYPLLSFQSVQSTPLTTQSYLIIFLVGFLYLLAAGASAALFLYIPMAFIESPLMRAISASCLWTLFELIRTYATFGLAWGLVGEPLIEFPPLAVFARPLGIYFLSFVVVLINVLICDGILRFPKGGGQYRWIFASVIAILFALVMGGLGIISLSPSPTLSSTTIVAVQPGVIPANSSSKEYFANLYQNTNSALQETPSPASTNLFILPGNYIPPINESVWQQDDVVRDALRTRMPDLIGYSSILFGFTYFDPSGNRYEAQGLIDQRGGRTLTMKEHLFPISDFVPGFLAKIFPDLTELSYNYATGSNIPLHDGNNTFGVLACSEEFSPEIALKLARTGSEMLIISGSNDDFTSPLAYFEAQRAVRWRAMENNTYAIEAMKSGITSFIDPLGKVVASIAKDQSGVLVIKL